MKRRGKWITEDEFVRESAMAGFLGAYKFWVTLMEDRTPSLRDFVIHGEALIRSMGLMAMEMRGGPPATPNEAEFFQYVSRKP